MIRRVALLALLAALLGAEGRFAVAQETDTYRFAYDRGKAVGEAVAREDRLAHRPFDYASRKEYQDALEGFDPSRHDREVYRVAFRRGFEDGYEAGYQRLESGGQSGTPSDRTEQVQGPFEGRVSLPEGTELRLRLQESLSSERNQAGDRFRCEVIEPFMDGERVVIPRGALVEGEIVGLKRAGRIRGRTEMTLAFHRLELPGGRGIPLDAMLVGLEARRPEEVEDHGGTVTAPSEQGKDARKVGLTTGIGALIGLLGGGGSGAQKGAVIGAAAGVTGVLATRGSPIFLPVETELVVRLKREVSIPVGMLRMGAK